MSAIRGSTVGTRLCDDCEGLRLDEERFGGFMGTSRKDQKPILRISRRWTPEDDEPKHVVPLLRQNRTDSSPDFPKLAESAAAGCAFCGFLRGAILRADTEALKEQGEAYIHLYYAWCRRRWTDMWVDERLQALVAELRVGGAHGEEVVTLCFYAYSRDKATADWLCLNSPPRSEALCPENISFLKRSLESCTSDCHPPAHTSFLPTRLLDVGTDAASQPRLIITAESIGPEARDTTAPLRYAALSYCWGNQDDAAAQTKTEPSNLHERLRAVPIDHMSAVMQDAVKVCRALSVRYLWIDALCIIQDPVDSSDWERESERVGQVFLNAYFTICAVASASCHQSFLDRRHDTFDFEFQSSLYPPARGTYTLLFTGREETLQGFDPVSTDLLNSSWDKRGWIFQEDQLSVRKLRFGPHMVYFDCGASSKAAENGMVSDWSVGADWSSAFLAYSSRMDLYRAFAWGLTSYAERKLLYESDRLPALSGIAKRVFDLVGGGGYLAGLWKEHLHIALLWHRCHPTAEDMAEHFAALRASTGSGAPSWSWASQPGSFDHGLPGFEVLAGERHLRPEYSAIDGWTVLKGAGLNQFGEVESGTIRVRGKVLSLPEHLVPTASRSPEDPSTGSTLWKVYQNGKITAYCVLDWISASPEQEPGKLLMLLLSSTCHGTATTRCRRPDTQNSEEDEDAEDDNEGDDEEHDENGHEDANEDRHEILEGDLSQGTSSEAEPASSRNERPFAPTDACVSCRNRKRNRRAWGLIIHPAEKAGEYYRVGVFLSPAGRARGTRLFKGVGDQTIDII